MALSSKSPTIPVITSAAQMEQMMQVWRNSLTRTLRQAPTPPPPQNFTATSARGGIQLNWSLTNPILTKNVLGQSSHPTGPDGYEILISKDGSFTDTQVVSLNDVTQTTYFHPTGGGPASFSFRIHSTAGTQSSPQSIFGPDTATIRHRSIDPTDVTTKPTTVVDKGTTDQVRSIARLGRYAHQYLNTYSGAKT